MASYIENSTDTAVLSRVYGLCGLNGKTWKDLTDAGTFRDCVTYQDYFTTLVNHYRYNKEIKELAAKAKLVEAEAKPRFKNTELRDQLDQVTIAEKIQKINLDKTRQEELLIKVLASRLEYVAKNNIESLLLSSFTNICNMLRHTAEENPEVQEVIDKCIKEIYDLALQLEEDAILDKQNYVTTKLKTEFSIEEITNTFDFTREDS
jgi:replicative DNA helicase